MHANSVILISWLLMKLADLDLHCFQMCTANHIAHSTHPDEFSCWESSLSNANACASKISPDQSSLIRVYLFCFQIIIDVINLKDLF